MPTCRCGVRRWVWRVVVTAGVFAAHVHAQEAEGPKQVLVLNSTRFDEQISVVTARELPKLLADGLGERIEYYTEFFDFPNFTQPEYESAYRDFLRLKYSGRRFDLLILMGSVAVDFMGRHPDLFSGTPAVFYAHNPPRSPLANSTGLISQLHFGRSIDLALALQPDLKHVYVVSGAAVADKAYERQARAEFRRFEGRVEFAYLSGLVTKDLLERLKTLPPHSAVYYVVVGEDGAGQNFQQMNYLSRVAATANAPTYSWADAAVETGIVGGRRRDQLTQLKAIAALALRVLRGEQAGSIPVSSPDTDVDQVDARQLRRWGLDESRVPAGTRLLFRHLTVWEQYRRYIVGAVMLMLAQTTLITGLLIQRTKRRRAELELRGSQTRLRDSYDRIRHLSRQLLIEQEAERARISRELHDDINQQLAILSIELDRLPPDQLPAQTAKRLSEALAMTHVIAKSVRDLSHRLHPPRLTPAGLVAGLESLCRDLSLTHQSITFSKGDIPRELDQTIALCLFRVAQEALRNAVKHSNASRIWVDLRAEKSSVAFEIADDGRGFVVGVTSAGLGLISMRERVESVGGVLEIQAAQSSGTRLRVTVPTRAPEASAEMASA